MKVKLIKAGACFLGVLGVFDLCCMFAEKCGVEIVLSPWAWVMSWIVLGLGWFLVDGLFVSGFLVKRVEIDLPNLRTCNIIVLTKKVIKELNLLEIKRSWESR